jgi:hypothetical protein
MVRYIKNGRSKAAKVQIGDQLRSKVEAIIADLADAVLAAATLMRFTTGAIVSVDGGRQLT